MYIKIESGLKGCFAGNSSSNVVVAIAVANDEELGAPALVELVPGGLKVRNGVLSISRGLE